MKQAEVFRNKEFGEIRIIEVDGKYLFSGVDVARALGYRNTRDAIIRHCKGVVKHDGVSETKNQHGTITRQTVPMSFIPEGDVYRLIAHSKLPTAEKFERWVFDEVLPCIRKHGGYMTPSLSEQVCADPTLIYQLAAAIVQEQNRNGMLQEELMKIKPKAAYYDAFINPGDCTNIRTTAKELNIPEKMFTAFLISHGYLYRAPAGNLLPYAKPGNNELFIVRDFYCRAGLSCYTLITPQGKDLFRHLRDQIC